jgi:hypothetical protein
LGLGPFFVERLLKEVTFFWLFGPLGGVLPTTPPTWDDALGKVWFSNESLLKRIVNLRIQPHNEGEEGQILMGGASGYTIQRLIKINSLHPDLMRLPMINYEQGIADDICPFETTLHRCRVTRDFLPLEDLMTMSGIVASTRTKTLNVRPLSRAYYKRVTTATPLHDLLSDKDIAVRKLAVKLGYRKSGREIRDLAMPISPAERKFRHMTRLEAQTWYLKALAREAADQLNEGVEPLALRPSNQHPNPAAGLEEQLAIATRPEQTPDNPTVIEVTPMDTENSETIAAIVATPFAPASLTEPMDILDQPIEGGAAIPYQKLPGGIKFMINRANEGVIKYFDQAKELQEEKVAQITRSFRNDLAARYAEKKPRANATPPKPSPRLKSVIVAPMDQSTSETGETLADKMMGERTQGGRKIHFRSTYLVEYPQATFPGHPTMTNLLKIGEALGLLPSVGTLPTCLWCGGDIVPKPGKVDRCAGNCNSGFNPATYHGPRAGRPRVQRTLMDYQDEDAFSTSALVQGIVGSRTLKEASNGKRILIVVTKHWDALLTPKNVKMARITADFRRLTNPLAGLSKDEEDGVKAAFTHGRLPLLHSVIVVRTIEDNDSPEIRGHQPL